MRSLDRAAPTLTTRLKAASAAVASAPRRSTRSAKTRNRRGAVNSTVASVSRRARSSSRLLTVSKYVMVAPPSSGSSKPPGAFEDLVQRQGREHAIGLVDAQHLALGEDVGDEVAMAQDHSARLED